MAAEIHRIGFLSDTHSNKADGSDLPQQALDAFAGVDLIVHLGDIGRKGVLERLGKVATVFVPAGDNKGYVPADARDTTPVKVIEAGGLGIGLAFNVSLPRKDIEVLKDGGLQFPDKPLPEVLRSKFGRPVDVVAFGGTHRQTELRHDGVLFFNPGSPTLPSDRLSDRDLGSVAVLDVRDRKAAVEFVRLTRS